MLLHLDILLFGMKHNQKFANFPFYVSDNINMKWNILSPIHVLSKDFIWFICVFYNSNPDFHTNKNTEFWIPYSASYFFEW